MLYHKSLFDQLQACLVKKAEYEPRSFFFASGSNIHPAVLASCSVSNTYMYFTHLIFLNHGLTFPFSELIHSMNSSSAIITAFYCYWYTFTVSAGDHPFYHVHVGRCLLSPRGNTNCQGWRNKSPYKQQTILLQRIWKTRGCWCKK